MLTLQRVEEKVSCSRVFVDLFLVSILKWKAKIFSIIAFVSSQAGSMLSERFSPKDSFSRAVGSMSLKG